MYTDRSIAASRIAMKPTAVFALALALLAARPGLALAASPTLYHEHFAGHLSLTADEFCGFPVDDAFVVNTIWQFNTDGSMTATGWHTDTYTNRTTGKSVVVSAAGPFKLGPRIVNEQAGTYSVTVSFIGLGIKVDTRQGGVLLLDGGLLSFTDTFLLATDEKVATTVVENGPHPLADSGFSAFCDVMLAALT